MNNYMAYLRNEYDELCKIDDFTITQKACRKVISDMFDGLTYGLSTCKLNMLCDAINNYRLSKQK